MGYECYKDDTTKKTVINRVGLQPIQGKDIEYEFTFLIQMSMNHFGHIIKDNTDNDWHGKAIEKPGVDFGK